MSNRGGWTVRLHWTKIVLMSDDEPKRDTVNCADHGTVDATFVCVHVQMSLSDGRATGFRWHIDEGGNFQAVCDACESMDEQTWAATASSIGRALCVDCFRKAAELNGVVIRSED